LAALVAEHQRKQLGERIARTLRDLIFFFAPPFIASLRR
jgi:hypothetical protein